MEVLGAIIGYGMAIMFGVVATIALGLLALVGRSRLLGATFVLSFVGTIGLIAWPSIQRAIDPERFPSPVEITRYGRGDLALDTELEFVPGPGTSECRHSQSAYLFRTVTMTEAGRLRGATLQVVLMLHPEDVSVFVVAMRGSGEPDVSWSGNGRLERGDEFAGRVTFDQLGRIAEPDAWPAGLSGEVEWSCPAGPMGTTSP